jgi:hypothetical protein
VIFPEEREDNSSISLEKNFIVEQGKHESFVSKLMLATISHLQFPISYATTS